MPLQLENPFLEKMISPICIPNPFVFSGRLEKMKGVMVKKQEHKAGMYNGICLIDFEFKIQLNLIHKNDFDSIGCRFKVLLWCSCGKAVSSP